ncbi:cysteinyl-tRNA synthetase [Paenalcaligenes hominis]|uniref:Cysteine--tRNA ligase n=1 Tax=Paenalcaligenes hominis TaxID=643674 RepID=A0ABX0WMY4_9BURK|nr:cysteine--tRNA ligase [Paenalcaligenes hominis]NJB64614.1 cysteinyl-tRNA synthetase [Paenalcaligenes hominis]GGE60377.1 cysteine--tRNA ligase [Paenalcaligenes hominis]
MLRIYSSLSRTKEIFKPVEPGKVRMYVCGMTVYDFCHLGHARMLVSFDVIQRWLRTMGYQVSYVRNITDIDDKIIRRAVERNQRMHEVTEFYINAMHADEKALNVQSPDFEPRATQHVGDMLGIIKLLEDKGLAYQGSDGDVNYAVRQFPGYGKLSGKSLDDLRAGERVAVADGKRDPLDFVLWKAAKDSEPAESKWQSAYGMGRPGWHIECSAMSHALLGMPLDIHGGGPDLKFPHHENEIAQSEGAFGGQMANVWMHCGPLMVDSDKMSKSLGNFFTIRETLSVQASDDQAHYTSNPREAEMLRFFIVRNHYRSTQNYAPDNLYDAQQALDRLYQTLANVPPVAEAGINWNSEASQQFREAMNDDFNTAGAVAVLFDLANQINREKCAELSAELKALGGVLGLLQHEPQVYLRSSTRYLRDASAAASTLTDTEIDALVLERNEAKVNKNFARADEIRAHLRTEGIELEDKAGGLTQWRRA